MNGHLMVVSPGIAPGAGYRHHKTVVLSAPRFRGLAHSVPTNGKEAAR